MDRIIYFTNKGECILRKLLRDDITYEIGVDIGGTKVLIAIADDDGNIVFKEKVKTSPDVRKIIQVIDDCIQRMNIQPHTINGIGIGVPGMVNSKDGIVIDAPSLKWGNLKLKEIFSEHYRVPIAIKNDVNLAILGERYFGGNKSNNIFYIAIGTGVGSAIIANGQIIEGTNYLAGEIGYFLGKEDVVPGRINHSLEFGTFERKTSGTALTLKGKRLGYSSPELFLQYRNNNPEVGPLIYEFTLQLSIAIANVVSLLNPELVVIGGGVAESLDCIIDQIRAYVAKFTPVTTRIELSKLGGEAGALGGIACFLDYQNLKLEA
ncbi:MAG TPA: ROK family transcriptional regulator [Firmicutes bacterium]|nr:ROK family transcriptional regulator [Bacillota bacterium]